MTETKEERIQRLLESKDYLFKHVIKFDCHTKCHIKLFQRIDAQLKNDGVET